MPSTLNRFSALAVRHSFRSRPQSVARSASRPAFFHCSTVRRDDEPAKPKSSPKEPKTSQPASTSESEEYMYAESAGEDEIVDYGRIADNSDPFWGFPNTMSQAQRQRVKKEWKSRIDHPDQYDKEEEMRAWRREVQAAQQRALQEWMEKKPQHEDEPPERDQVGLLGMGEDHPDDQFADPEDEGNDIHSKAHGDLEQHREIREYMRIAAWEMPLLTKYAQKFEPPTSATPLRFRHTNYMGETHPAQNKIVLEFCTADLPLTPAQRLKLIKLVGVRYDPRKDLVKMSCEMFETPAQNKRYLGDLVDTLMLEAKNESKAEGAKDKFEDVAPDFRHVKHKPRHAFPSAWKLTPERKAELDMDRSQRTIADQDRRDTGRLVSGEGIIDTAMKQQTGQMAQVVLEQTRAGIARPTAPRV